MLLDMDLDMDTNILLEDGSTPLSNGEQATSGYQPGVSPTPADNEPSFPQLRNDDAETSLLESTTAGALGEDDNDDEPAVAKPFIRTSSPDPNDQGEAYTEDSSTAGSLDYQMHKFSLYETASRYYIVGGDLTERRYRLLKIDRTTDDSELSMTDDKIIYSQREMNQLLDTIDHGNKGTGGMKLRCTTWGLLGFIKFMGPYYMVLITKKSTVATVGGHCVYQIEGTELVPLTPAKFKADGRNTEELRFLGILNNLDLTRSFYYSYSYNITRTLQHNLSRERDALAKGIHAPVSNDFNSMFVWNSHLLQPAESALRDPYDWCRPIIHGYIDQAALSIYGRTAHITVIARRSRHFAGARFLKRGANDLGYVANDVETEQIVSEALTTPFHAPGPRLFCNHHFTSYVQHRGSIPLHWVQETAGVTPKPPIELNLVDPFYSAAALHFDNLFERYGAPIYALDLVKSRERTPRESKLLAEYTNAIKYLNQFLPSESKIIHKAWDMSRAAKSRDQDVIGTLENIAEEVMNTTGFFHNGDGVNFPARTQNGVARTNCIDCLDRTNAAQFVIGKRALGHQLHALGILEDTSIDYDTDAVNLFTHMYHDHGDTIAVQYGGSQLVNTMETYRKINQWTSHSRDMIESFKRYYNNSFLDGQRQEAYNLFLGNYKFAHGQPMLWDLTTDYYLHHSDPRAWVEQRKHEYVHWFTPEYLAKRTLPPYAPPAKRRRKTAIPFVDDYWLEYYRPSTLSSFMKMFPYKMNSTIKYIPFRAAQDGKYDLSPFRVRVITDLDDSEKPKGKKEVTIVDPGEHRVASRDDGTVEPANKSLTGRGISIRWLQPAQEKAESHHGIMKETGASADAAKPKQSALEKSREAQWTFTKAVRESLNPSVSTSEMEDYASYIAHPHSLPLVVSAQPPEAYDSEYQDYIYGNRQADFLFSTGSEDEFPVYEELLRVDSNPLTVTEEDSEKKRYKAYQKWLRGKSFFKQQPVD
ncbi:related to polyphosphoinositide phosphatase family member [Cephalotrichum gorgonifer]|uniref:Related to polyphosphoinositide phosphatase family member n=1 Tax=Cephalotrichum gorgonifer TaxID=2041049 RepID=A0AAE8MZF6_9PEZI|nr:related to polyphosphoinositide phosphatase family member [Cephalotrichum gorgonifer]